MKIIIDSDGHHFTIPVPILLLKNKFCVRVAVKSLEKYTKGQITEEHLYIFLNELKKARRNFKHLLLVDVQDSGGEKVKIFL